MAHSKIYVARRHRHLNPSSRYLLVFLLGCLLQASPALAQMTLPELSHELNRVEPPKKAPDFGLDDMDGERHSLADYKGKVVILNFWATWCPPCRREIPSMEAIHNAFRDEDFAILAINEWETEDHVFAFTGQLAVDPTFPILFDKESEVAQDYGVKGLPTTVFLDKKGRIVYRAVGGRDFDHPEVKKIIRGLLQDDGETP